MRNVQHFSKLESLKLSHEYISVINIYQETNAYKLYIKRDNTTISSVLIYWFLGDVSLSMLGSFCR